MQLVADRRVHVRNRPQTGMGEKRRKEPVGQCVATGAFPHQPDQENLGTPGHRAELPEGYYLQVRETSPGSKVALVLPRPLKKSVKASLNESNYFQVISL